MSLHFFFIKMNYSIFSLHVSSVSLSPFFSVTKRGTRVFDKIRATKLFSGFYFSNYANKLTLKRSKFQQIGNTAIKLSSTDISNFAYKGRGFTYSDDDYVNFLECSFVECKSNDKGGAILIDIPQNIFPQLNIYTSYFVKCSSNFGGAIYAGTERCDIKKVCFSGCYATESYNAALIYSNGKNISKFQFASISRCPESSNNIPSTILLTGESIRFTGNISNNVNSADGVLISAQNAGNIYVWCSYFSHNKGNSGFLMKYVKSIVTSNIFVTNNTIDEPFSIISEHRNTHFTITRSQITHNKYSNKSQEKMLAYFDIYDSFFDAKTQNLLRNVSAYMTVYGVGIENNVKIFQVFTTQPCEYKEKTEQQQNVKADTKKTVLILLAISSCTAIVIVLVILYIGSARKRDESNWILKNQSRMENLL